MNAEQFLMILPSNSSMRYFPENTTGSFTTESRRRVDLNGQWEVALINVQFLCSFLHIRPRENSVHLMTIENLTKSVKTTAFDIPTGIYNNLNVLLRTLNSASEKIKAHVAWQIEPLQGGKIFLYRTCKSDVCSFAHYVKFSDQLRRILGFDIFSPRPGRTGAFYLNPDEPPILYNPNSGVTQSPHRIIQNFYYEITTSDSSGDSEADAREKKSPSSESESEQALASDLPASLPRGLPDQLFVYCDICEPYVTGDVHSPLLQVVSLNHTNGRYSFGCNTEKNFSPPNYIPLRTTSFSTIEIDIRDQTGEQIPFEFGTLIATLHFRRCD